MQLMQEPQTVVNLGSRRDRAPRGSAAKGAAGRRERRRRIEQAMAVRRVFAAARSRSTGGRAWVNGVELGGARLALAHLAESYD